MPRWQGEPTKGWAWCVPHSEDIGVGATICTPAPEAEQAYKELARAGNVTSFTQREQNHPINFFEQARALSLLPAPRHRR